MKISRIFLTDERNEISNDESFCILEDYQNIRVCNGRKLSINNGFSTVTIDSETKEVDKIHNKIDDVAIKCFVDSCELKFYKDIADSGLGEQGKCQENYNRRENKAYDLPTKNTMEVDNLGVMLDSYTSDVILYDADTTGDIMIEQLIYIDIDISLLFPYSWELGYANGKVIDTYRMTDSVGFLLAVILDDFNLSIDVVFKDGGMWKISIDYNMSVRIAPKFPFAKTKWKDRKDKKMILEVIEDMDPFLAELSPYAPASLVLFTESVKYEHDISRTIRKALGRYPHMPVEKIKEYINSNEYPDMFEDNCVIAIQIPAIDGIEKYEKFLIDLLKMNIIPRFRRPVRSVSVISDSKINVYSEQFWKQLNIHYVNLINFNGTTESCIPRIKI